MAKADDSELTWRVEIMISRLEMVRRIRERAPDTAAMEEVRKKISEEKGISERTLRRYEKSYAEKGVPGLMPASRSGIGAVPLPENFDMLLDQAIELRREVPKRSVNEIIRTLEREKRVPKGELKRSTLQRHMYNEGFGEAHMKAYQKAETSSTKRWTRTNRMLMTQADIKLKKNFIMGGKKTVIYLTSIIDVHSRRILYSIFYSGQTADIVEDTVREAILRYGRMETVYVDHGSQYISAHLKRACAELDITIRYAPVASGCSKGSIERFHQHVDRFLLEADIANVESFDQLNILWTHYLDKEYHNQPHEGIREYYKQNLGITLPTEGITPLQEWDRDTRPLEFLDREKVAEAFLHHEERTIDQGGCIRFKGMKYFGNNLPPRTKVEIIYDPRSPEVLTVHSGITDDFESRPAVYGDRNSPPPKMPDRLTKKQPGRSRVLDAIEKEIRETPDHHADALSFADYRERRKKETGGTDRKDTDGTGKKDTDSTGSSGVSNGQARG